MLKSSIKILIIIVLVYAVGRFFVVYQDSRLIGERAPYIQMLTTNSVIIHWSTEEEHLGVVRYGEDSQHLAKIELDEDTTTEHIVTLPNLKPATRYYYQVGDTSGFAAFDPEINWFKTYPENVVATRIWVLGDSGEAGETLNLVRDEAIGWMKKCVISGARGGRGAGSRRWPGATYQYLAGTGGYRLSFRLKCAISISAV